MKFYKLIVFSIPFVLYIFFILIIDPYNFFSTTGFIPQKIISNVAPEINVCLWNLIKYEKNQCKSVLLGDSRMALLITDSLKLKYQRNFYNLSYASASLNEMIYTFWYITKKVKIDTIMIGISLEKYNQTFVRDRVQGVISILKNPLLYFTNYNVPQASYICLKEYYSKKIINLHKPKETVDDFWKYQINVSGVKYYSSYKYSKYYHTELQKISSYCKKNNIKLTFVIFPVHTDLQDLISVYKLEMKNKVFIEEISQLGDVFDFSFQNEITKDKKYFNDPFHLKTAVFVKYYMPILFAKEKQINDSLVKYHTY